MAAPQLAALSSRNAPPPALPFSALSVMVEHAPPPAVGVAVFATDPDVFQVLGRLSKLGYKGRVIALAPPLPRRSIVEKEMRAQGPGLRLRLVCLPSLVAP